MLCFLLLSLAASNPGPTRSTTLTCDVRKAPYNAVGDNITDETAILQRAIEECDTVLLSGPATYLVTESLMLTSNLTVRLDANTTIHSRQPLCDPHGTTPDPATGKVYPRCKQTPGCPTLYWSTGPTAILCGTNLTNVALIGADPDTSIIDGGGWPWYTAGVQNKSMQGQGPRAYELAWSKNITLQRVGFHNSPSWTVRVNPHSGPPA